MKSRDVVTLKSIATAGAECALSSGTLLAVRHGSQLRLGPYFMFAGTPDRIWPLRLPNHGDGSTLPRPGAEDNLAVRRTAIPHCKGIGVVQIGLVLRQSISVAAVVTG